MVLQTDGSSQLEILIVQVCPQPQEATGMLNLSSHFLFEGCEDMTN